MDSKIACCLCCVVKDGSIHIFSAEGTAFNITAILKRHFELEINDGDGSPQYICIECWDITRNFHNLYRKVKETLKSYVELIGQDNNLGTRKIVNANQDERESSNIDFNIDCIKSEPDIFVDNLKIEVNSENDDINTLLNIDEQYPMRQAEKRKITENTDEIESTKPRSKREKLKKNSCQRNYREEIDSIEDRDERERKRQEEDSLIRDYFAMACEMCPIQFQTFLEARGHYRKAHQKAGYLACCNKRFFYRGGLIDHISVHLNPETFKCQICEKTYGNKFALADHMELKHLPQEHKQYACEKCDRKFAKLYRLKQHVEISHIGEQSRKMQMICDNCGKTFSSKSSILTHIRDAHLRNFSKMCDVCAKTFNCEKSFKTHCLTHTDQPRMQCNVCGSWLKSKDSLRSHLRRHTDTEHTCPYCNKVAPNRQAMANHILYVHGERNHKCTLCDKAFKVALGLKEHMASHTGQSLYTCPYCPKTFNSNGNMHKHRKNVHSVEWKNDRGKRMKELNTGNE